MNTLHYTVEYRHKDTGYWTEEASFKPDYDEAERDARVRALRVAKQIYQSQDVRVRCCDEFKNYDWWNTVWINGQFKDC